MALTLFAQVIFGVKQQYPILIFYAFRNYLLYLPLVQVIISNFKRVDILRTFKAICICAMVSAPLMVVQFVLPPDNPINQGFGGVKETRFENLGFPEGVMRTGLFTSSAANSIFTLMSVAAFIYIITTTTIHGRMFTLAAGVSVFICAAFSGSRGVFFQLPIIIMFAFFGLLLARRGNKMLTFLIIGIFMAIIAIPLIAVLAPSLLEATTTRFDEANVYESKRAEELG